MPTSWESQPETGPQALAGTSRSWLLAIDTSTDQAGIALFDGAQIAEVTWPSGRHQTTSVMPAMEWLLQRVGIGVEEIGAVAVAIGPGSFTGLRVGLSIAKGLAALDERAVIGVPTLDLVAHPCTVLDIGCIAVIPAGRGRVVWSAYGGEGPETQPSNAAFDEFRTAAGERKGTVIIGELSAVQRERLLQEGARLAPATLANRASALAQIGWDRWQSGQVNDPITLEPIYLHGRPNPR